MAIEIIWLQWPGAEWRFALQGEDFEDRFRRQFQRRAPNRFRVQEQRLGAAQSRKCGCDCTRWRIIDVCVRCANGHQFFRRQISLFHDAVINGFIIQIAVQCGGIFRFWHQEGFFQDLGLACVLRGDKGTRELPTFERLRPFSPARIRGGQEFIQLAVFLNQLRFALESRRQDIRRSCPVGVYDGTINQDPGYNLPPLLKPNHSARKISGNGKPAAFGLERITACRRRTQGNIGGQSNIGALQFIIGFRQQFIGLDGKILGFFSLLPLQGREPGQARHGNGDGRYPEQQSPTAVARGAIGRVRGGLTGRNEIDLIVRQFWCAMRSTRHPGGSGL